MVVEKKDPAMIPTGRDMLSEDRLLWELWLNHGLDDDALRARFRELDEAASGEYLVSNALYGCFEDRLERLAGSEEGSAPPGLTAAIRRMRDGRPVRLTPEVPEGKLLALLTLRPAPGTTLAAECSAAAGRVTSWGALRRAACRANVVPAVVISAAALGIASAFPAAEWASLQEAAEGIARRNERLLDLIRRVLDASAGAGLSPVLLKETALLGDVYGAADRMIGDIDILYAPSEIDESEKVLLGMGYTPFEGIWSRAWYRENHHHLAPLVSAREAVKIEPHMGIWIPSGPSSPIVPEIIAASHPHPTFRAGRPSATHLLFHMLVDLHGNASIGKLGQAADIAALVSAEGGSIEARGLADLSRRTGATPFVEDSLFLLSRIYGDRFIGAVPGMGALLPAKGPALERRLLRSMALANAFGFDPAASDVSLAGARLIHRALLMPGTRLGRVSFVMSSVFGKGKTEEGAGAISMRGNVSRGKAFFRAVTFPFRLAFKAASRPKHRA